MQDQLTFLHCSEGAPEQCADVNALDPHEVPEIHHWADCQRLRVGQGAGSLSVPRKGLSVRSNWAVDTKSSASRWWAASH